MPAPRLRKRLRRSKKTTPTRRIRTGLARATNAAALVRGAVRGDAALSRAAAAVTTEDYRRALESAVREYEELGERRRDIDTRLAEVAQTIGTLSRLCGLTPTVPMGLTDACRLIVRGAGVPMTPPDVRDRQHAIGVDLSKYVNDLAAIHTVLKRLNESGELRFIARGTGKQAYIWNRPARAAALGPDIAAFMRASILEREATQASAQPAPPRAKGRRGTKTTKNLCKIHDNTRVRTAAFDDVSR